VAAAVPRPPPWLEHERLELSFPSDRGGLLMLQ
jgi:hypothetical protein